MTQVMMEKPSTSKVKSQIYELAKDKKTVIGRSDNCHITINKPAISSEHANIFFEEDSFWVKDNDSCNGTRVNGLPISDKTKLNLNDVVRVGDYSFTLVCEYCINRGRYYYLEIRKIKKSGGASFPSTDSIKMTVDEEVKSKALQEFKEKLKSDDSKTVEQTKPEKGKKSSQKAKAAKVTKKSSNKKNKKSKKKAYIASLGAGVATRLKEFKLTRQVVISRIKEVAVLSIICHVVIFYLAENYFGFGDEQRKEMKEIIMTLKEEEIIQDIQPQELEVEDIETVVNEIAPTNLALELDLDANAVSSSKTISEAMEDLEASTVSVVTGSGTNGNIAIGRGQNGVRDAAFKKRVLGAKGRYNGVDVRATLIWNDVSDLDLYAVNPTGEEIYYGRKESGGGTLDIDKNASDPVRDPVENIIFQTAADGDYIIQLKLFAARKRKAVPFKIEFVVFGDVYYYKGIINSEKQEKEIIDIVNFTCREGKYRINSYINQKPPEKMPEIKLDLLDE